MNVTRRLTSDGRRGQCQGVMAAPPGTPAAGRVRVRRLDEGRDGSGRQCPLISVPGDWFIRITFDQRQSTDPGMSVPGVHGAWYVD